MTNDAYPAMTSADTDWVNDPAGYGINHDELEHSTGVSDGMSLAALTDIPTPYGIDVAKPSPLDDPAAFTSFDVPESAVGYEPVMVALRALMAMYANAVKTREVRPTRITTQRFVIPPGATPFIALGSDPYRRRLLVTYSGAVVDQPQISTEAGSGEGFPIPLTTYLELTAVDEIWLMPAGGATNIGNATVSLLFERDSEPLS